MSKNDDTVVVDGPGTAALPNGADGRWPVAGDSSAEGVLALQPVYVIPESDGLVLHTQSFTLQLRGAGAALYHLIAPLLTGRHDRTAILESIDGGARDAASALIDRLIEKRVVRTQPADFARGIPEAAVGQYESIALHWGRGTPDWSSVRKLRDSHVLVVGGSTTSAALVRGLIQSGVGKITLSGSEAITALDVQRSAFVTPEEVGRPWSEVFAEREPLSRLGVDLSYRAQPEDDAAAWSELLAHVDVAVVAISGPSQFSPALSALNAAALETGTPWLTVANLDNDEVTVGPFITPGITACHTCLHHRLKSNLRGVETTRRVEEFVSGGGAPVDFGYCAPAMELAANIACREICNSLLPERMAHSMGKLIAIDFENLRIDSHAVLKLPRCPSCSPTRGQPRPRIWAV